MQPRRKERNKEPWGELPPGAAWQEQQQPLAAKRRARKRTKTVVLQPHRVSPTEQPESQETRQTPQLQLSELLSRRPADPGLGSSPVETMRSHTEYICVV